VIERVPCGSQIQNRNLEPALQWVEDKRADLAAARQSYEAFEFQLHRLQFLRILTQQGARCDCSQHACTSKAHCRYADRAAAAASTADVLHFGCPVCDVSDVRPPSWSPVARLLSALQAWWPAGLSRVSSVAGPAPALVYIRKHAKRFHELQARMKQLSLVLCHRSIRSPTASCQGASNFSALLSMRGARPGSCP
jgi:CTLH/CRA C-terminal to LisH motif domain